MCVIIYIPQGSTISYQELKDAWTVNSDGAGYSYLRDGEVLYHRGFMDFSPFYDEIKNKIGKNPLLLHFRISTSDKVNALQTHMYDKTDLKRLKGITKNPIICMNGVINGQYCYQNFNDTMSYIKDHDEVFKIIAENGSSELLNIVEDATNSRWAMLTTDGIILSHGFQWQDGKAYSNKNHLWSYSYRPSSQKKTEKTLYISDKVQKDLIPSLIRDRNLLYKVADHVEFYCNYRNCSQCIMCLSECESLEEVEKVINWSMFY